MIFTKQELLQALENQILKHNLKSEINVDEVVIDSRKALKNTLFFALKGDNNDGHDFLNRAFENGCEISIIHDLEFFEKNRDKYNLILVKDTFLALYELAKYSRQRSKAKVIAVTGSVGKTGVKEMLKAAFLAQGKTDATVGNLNNHFGLPLTICNASRDCRFLILEMGMNHLHEIDSLTRLAKPHIAIITTIAPAHIGNFNNEEEIALAKSEIFSGLEQQGFALINHDNKYYDFLKKEALNSGVASQNILSFGANLQSDYCLSSLEIQRSSSSLIKVITKNHGEFSYEISSAHKATIFNSLIILACLDIAISSREDINKSLLSLKNLQVAKGRGEIIEICGANKNITIIDDSYNANVASMKAGIEYLADLKNITKKQRSIAILGDMFELGDKAQEFHEEVLKFAIEKKIDFIFPVGENMKKAAKILDKNCKTYLNPNELFLDIKSLADDGDLILIKGSRGMKMESIIQNLTDK